MPTVTEITLKAGNYMAKLESVVQATRDARAKMEATAGGDVKATVTQEVKGTEEVRKAKREIESIPAEKEVKIKVDTTTSGTGGNSSGAQSAASAGNAAKESGEKADNSRKKWKQFAEQISKGGGTINAFSSALGMVSPQLGMLGQGLSAVASGMLGVVTIGAGLAAVLVIHLWDRFTVSLEEAAAKLGVWTGMAERARQKEEALQSAMQKHLDKLRELSSAETTHKNALGETAAAIDALERRYGDLGAVIDKTTGRLRNYQEVARRVREEEAKRQGIALSDSLETLSAQSQKEYELLRRKELPWDAKGYYKMQAEVDAGRFGNLTGTQRLEVLRAGARKSTNDDITQRYNKLIEATEKQIELEKQLAEIRKTRHASPEAAEEVRLRKESDVAAAKNAIDQLDREAARRRADSELTRTIDPAARIANRQGLIDREQARQPEMRDRIVQAEKDLTTAQDQGERLVAEKQRLDAVSELKKSEAEVAALETEIAQIKHEQAEGARKLVEQSKFELDYAKLIAAGEYDKATALKQEYELRQQNLRVGEAEKKILLDNRKAMQAVETGKQITEGKLELEIQKLILAGEYEKAAALKLQLDAKRQNKTLSEAEKKALLDTQKAMQDLDTSKQLQTSKEEIELQRLLVAGRYDEYEALKLKLDMQKQNKKLTEEETRAFLQQREAEKTLTLQQNLKDQGRALLYSTMEQAGMGQEAAYQKALYDAEKTKGSTLSGAEAEMVRKLTELSLNLSASIPAQLGDLSIKTNDLTARGGFASGAVMPDKDEVNRAIRSNTQHAAEALQDITTWLGKLGISIQKGSEY